jgi:hypothetical protein
LGCYCRLKNGPKENKRPKVENSLYVSGRPMLGDAKYPSDDVAARETLQTFKLAERPNVDKHL